MSTPHNDITMTSWRNNIPKGLLTMSTQGEDGIVTSQWHHGKQYIRWITDHVYTRWRQHSLSTMTSWQTVYKMDYWSCPHRVKTVQSQHSDIMAKQYTRRIIDRVHTWWRQYSCSTMTAWETKYKDYWQCPHRVRMVQSQHSDSMENKI